MKKFYPLFILLTLFLSSCKNLNDKRLDSVVEYLAKSSKQENIVILSSDFKSLAIPSHSYEVIKEVSEKAVQLEKYKNNISEYKKEYFAEQSRVWMKNMTEQQKISYKNLMVEYDKLEFYFNSKLPSYYDYKEYYKFNTEINTSLWVKYKEGNSETIKYGVFYFNGEPTTVTGRLLFDEQTYNDTKKFMNIAEEKVKAGYLVPTLDSIGLDVVPADEDPSKTRKERKAIKEKEEIDRRAKERADMMRTNPIQRTFYGATLGTNSVNKIINRLKHRGFNVIEYTSGSYLSMLLDRMDVVFWDEIRIITENEKITKIELTQTLNLDLDPETQEKAFEKFYNNIVKKYREKYSFWQIYLSGTYYKDEKTTLKIENDGHSRVWATYTLNE